MWSLLKLGKFISLALLFSGTLGAFLPRNYEDRKLFGLPLAGAGFLGTWGFGFGLAYYASHSLFQSWIGGAMVLSFVSLQLVIYGVAADGRRSLGLAVAALATFLGALTLMVFRPA